LLVTLVTGLLTSICCAQQLDWDGPAIDVHPNHNEVVLHPEMVPLLIQQGRRLFETKFNEMDGAGRPRATGDSKPTPRSAENGLSFSRIAGPDASACSACHNQPQIGGSGDFATNVFVGAHFTDPPTKSVNREVTNERNTTSLFGSGLIELLAMEMTRELHARRSAALDEAAKTATVVKTQLIAKGVKFGDLLALPNGDLNLAELRGVDYDLVVRPFGVKGIAASLREFTIAALNQHHGIQAVERFGWERTGVKDFDGDGVEEEFSVGQLTALVVFQAQLSPPPQLLSSDATRRAEEAHGQQLFENIGCVNCHKAALPLDSSVFREPNPFNRPGTITPSDVMGTVNIDLSAGQPQPVIVRAYTDLKRHNLCDPEVGHFCNEVRKQDNVDTELFLTAKLWDAASSAPYGHRGDLRTLSTAILAHGGEARRERQSFLQLDDPSKRALIAFLQTLGRSPD
jgi:cytochrome c peroxidase